MQYVKVSELPTAVQVALKSVGYGRADIEVRASATVSLSSAGGQGSRSFVTLVNLTTGQHVTTRGSWGGPNMFTPDNAVDNDHGNYQLPPNGVAITGSEGGGGRPVYAVLHIPASMVERMLPGPGVELSQEERDALYCHRSIKGGHYRRDELQRRRVRPPTVDDLVTRGLLKRNATGATSITTEGRNALGDYRGH